MKVYTSEIEMLKDIIKEQKKEINELRQAVRRLVEINNTYICSCTCDQVNQC